MLPGPVQPSHEGSHGLHIYESLKEYSLLLHDYVQVFNDEWKYSYSAHDKQLLLDPPLHDKHELWQLKQLFSTWYSLELHDDTQVFSDERYKFNVEFGSQDKQAD